MKITYIFKKHVSLLKERYSLRLDRYVDKQFQSMLFCGTMSTIVSFITLFIGNLVAGNLLGENALTTITLVSPYISLLIFTASMNSIGVSINIAFEFGRGDKNRASDYFSQGLISAGAISLLTVAFSLLFQEKILTVLGAQADVLPMAQAYLKFLTVYMVALPFDSLLLLTLMVEWDIRRLNLAVILSLVVNVAVSIPLCFFMGIGGISLALGISTVVDTLILLVHFIKGRNTVSFHWRFKWGDVWNIVKFSMNDAVAMLFFALYTVVMNRLLLQRFGEYAIVIFAVILNLSSIVTMGFDGVGQAMQPLISAYHGEKNPLGVRTTMDVSLKAALLEGALMTALLLCFASLIPKAYGIVTADTAEKAAAAIRLFSLSLIPASLNLLWSSYLTYIDKIILSVSNVTMRSLVLRVLCMVLMGYLLGLNGIWIGAVMAEVFSLLVTYMAVKRIAPKNRNTVNTLLLLDEKIIRDTSHFSFTASIEGVMQTRDAVEAALNSRGISRKICFKAMMVVEEFGMTVVERNRGGKAQMELYLFYGEKMRLTFRDNGVEKQAIDEGQQPNGTMAYVRKRVLSASGSNSYQLSIGDNRTTFEIPC